MFGAHEPRRHTSRSCRRAGPCGLERRAKKTRRSTHWRFRHRRRGAGRVSVGRAFFAVPRISELDLDRRLDRRPCRLFCMSFLGLCPRRPQRSLPDYARHATALVAAASLLVIGERIPPNGWIGIISLCCGLFLLVSGRPSSNRAMRLALGTAICTGIYTLIDGQGSRIAGNVGSYIAWQAIGQSIVFLSGVGLLRRKACIEHLKPMLVRTLPLAPSLPAVMRRCCGPWAAHPSPKSPLCAKAVWFLPCSSGLFG